MRVLLVGAVTGLTATGPNEQLIKPGPTTCHVVDEVSSIAGIMVQMGVQSKNITVLAKNKKNDIRKKMCQMGVNVGNITFRSATATDVLNCLRNENWDIIHFAGHSHWHTVPPDLCRHSRGSGCSFHQKVQSSEAGLMVFEEPGDINPKNPYHGDALCLYQILKRNPSVKFIYFSSCRSGRDVILTEAMRHSLAIFALGFLWSVNDADACKFAIYFYEQLFRYLSNDANNPVAEAVWQTQCHFSVPGGQLGTLAPVLISQHF
ncbi:MAG: CHAT domain-containing protein [Candidatus Poribacteria bacterium]